VRLTDTRIRSLRPRKSRYELSDDGCVGLYVRVTASGTKSFTYKYRRFGKLVRKTLGQYPYLSLHEARSEATDLTTKVKLGQDIASTSETPLTVNGLVGRYVEHLKQQEKRTWREDQRILNKDFLPRFGNRPASAVSKPDLIAMLNEIAVGRNAGYMANRTQSCVHSFFRWAACEDLISADPSTGIRKRAKEHSRDRSLSVSEIRALWLGLDGSPLSHEMQIALKLILLTGKRTTEIIQGQWSDIQDDWWVTPSQKSKTGIMNRTPLLSLSRTLIVDLRILSGQSGWLFPSPRKEEPIRVDSVCRAVHRLRQSLEISHWTSKDLRRTAATHMGRLGVQSHIIGKILNHSDGAITAIYNRHEYDDEKRDALRLWDREVARILADDGQALQAA